MNRRVKRRVNTLHRIAEGRTRWIGVGVPLLLLVAVTGCGKPASTGASLDPPEFDDPRLEAGRSTWMMTCRTCHLTGVAGAPAVSDFDAWSPRLAKGRSALHLSALNGIPSADGEGWTMPPRGGNSRLSEAQVVAAADYMLAAATHERESAQIPD